MVKIMNKNGFTLTELLAVIVIIGLLIIVMFPAYIEVSNSMKETSLKNTKSILVNNMIEEANKKYIDIIKPAGNTCSSECYKCFSVGFMVNEGIFQTTDGKITNPETNQDLDGFVKISFDKSNYKLKGEFLDKNDAKCDSVHIYR